MTRFIDQFPTDRVGELSEEHSLLESLFEEAQGVDTWDLTDPLLEQMAAFQKIKARSRTEQVRVVRAATERMRWSITEGMRPNNPAMKPSMRYLAENTPQHFMTLIQKVVKNLCRKSLPVDEADLIHLLKTLDPKSAATGFGIRPYGAGWNLCAPVLRLAKGLAADKPISPELATEIRNLAQALRDPETSIDARPSERLDLARQLDRLAPPAAEPYVDDAASADDKSADFAEPLADDPTFPETEKLVELKAWLEGRPLTPAAATRVVGPDEFPLTVGSALEHEHDLLSRSLQEISRTRGPLDETEAGKSLLETLKNDGGRVLIAACERASAFMMGPLLSIDAPGLIWNSRYAALSLSHLLIESKPRLSRESLFDAIVFLSAAAGPAGSRDIGHMEHLVGLAEKEAGARPLSSEEITVLRTFRNITIDSAPMGQLPELTVRINRLTGDHSFIGLVPGEYWSDLLNRTVAVMSSNERSCWLAFLEHARKASGSRPSPKWLAAGRTLVDSIGATRFAELTARVFLEIDRGRSQRIFDRDIIDRKAVNELIHPENGDCLRGWIWLCVAIPSSTTARLLGKTAMSGYRKVRGVGPRAVKVGNAAVYSLSMIGSIDAVGQLAMMKARVKFGTALKEIEKAYAATAAALELPVEEIEEMAVPTYGLTDVGMCEEAMGEFTARLTVTGTDSTELVWLKADGKPQKSVPASVKASHAEELKELQAAAKDIQRMLPAQRERIDALFLQQKSWPLAIWRERYLDHPLVGVLARRLIWEFTTGVRTTAAMFFPGSRRRESASFSDGAESQRGLKSAATEAAELGVVDLDLRPVPADDTTVVRLWHPIGKEVDEVLAWRGWLETQRIQQPFKQAHREVYLLTDAERRTSTYSNRYAAHILKQHQFNALCAARGWKNKLHLMVDAEYPPASRPLPQWNLRAEFWVEGAGTDYGTDTNESGTYLHLTTDQVRFYRQNAAQLHAQSGSGTYVPAYGQTAEEPLPLEQIPPLVFSEIMRDVDLFVGVASVGNDPTWNDGGPGGQHREYWQSYAFGDLSVSAKCRKDILERLVPRLKIAQQCSFADKFLVVRGSLRTYKIHLGSGNILMEPNDQYLCIVPKQGATEKEPVFLPFEGDRTLSVILSKAFLLADDGKIKDASIRSQIGK